MLYVVFFSYIMLPLQCHRVLTFCAFIFMGIQQIWHGGPEICSFNNLLNDSFLWTPPLRNTILNDVANLFLAVFISMCWQNRYKWSKIFLKACWCLQFTNWSIPNSRATERINVSSLVRIRSVSYLAWNCLWELSYYQYGRKVKNTNWHVCPTGKYI